MAEENNRLRISTKDLGAWITIAIIVGTLIWRIAIIQSELARTTKSLNVHLNRCEEQFLTRKEYNIYADQQVVRFELIQNELIRINEKLDALMAGP